MANDPATKAKFLNVDLEIGCETGLNALLRHLEREMFVLHHADDWARLELNESGDLSLDATLREMAAALAALPPEAMQLWQACHLRRLDIGIEGSVRAAATGFTISPETLARLTATGAELALTIYSPASAD